MSNPQAGDRKGYRSRKDRYFAAFKSSSDSMLFIDPAGTILDANPGFFQRFRKLPVVAIGANVFDLLSTDPQGALIAEQCRVAVNEAVQTRRRVIIEDEQDSRILKHSILPVIIAENGVAELLVVTRDITELKRSRCGDESFCTSLLEAIPAATLVVDAHLRLVGWNRFSMDTINARSDGEMFGINPLDRVHPDYLGELRNKFFNVLEQDVEEAAEFRMFHKDGPPYKWATVRAKRVMIDDKPCVVAVVTETTELKQAQEERAQLQVKLQQSQKMDMLGRFAGGLAHDLNNALAAILGNTELILNQLDENHPFHESLEIIERSGHRSADMVRRLLAFAKMQAMRRIVIDLDEELSVLRPMLVPLISKNIRLQWHLENSHSRIRIDPFQLVQIITNLCLNSIDSIVDAGTISIETATTSVIPADCHAGHPGQVHGEYVRLSVSDSGCGIEETVMPHIFEPFFSTKGFGKASGLGLSMVYGIVRQNLGFIECRSEDGAGTVFNLYFPKQDA